MAGRNDSFPSQHVHSFHAALGMLLIILLSFLASCGGEGTTLLPLDNEKNVGGGYTLIVTGGNLNDGSGTAGFVVLATLRDSAGNGPSTPWSIAIDGPGLGLSLKASYDDGSPSSYMTWWWEDLDPRSGTYTATATNGITTLVYSFSVNAASTMARPVVTKNGSTLSWSAVSGAGSYYYRVTDGSGWHVTTGYYSDDPLQTTYSFVLPALSDGSYLVAVYAMTTDRIALQNDLSPSPSLAPQENMSLGAVDFVQGGGYALDAAGGVLYEGEYPSGTSHYGLVIWSSILTTTAQSTAPAGDWTLSVAGPGIPAADPITFTYPASHAQYLYWDFGTTPADGIYTVTAVPKAGGSPISRTFSIPAPAARLDIVTGLTATPVTGGGVDVSWAPVTGAGSYYVNVWTDAGGVYTEVAGSWVASTSVSLPVKTLAKGVSYDVYVTASQLVMTDTSTVPPAAPAAQADMSDTTFTYVTITAK